MIRIKYLISFLINQMMTGYTEKEENKWSVEPKLTKENTNYMKERDKKGTLFA